MKIGVIGGGGDQGSISVIDLVMQEDVESVIVGDINPEKAKERFKDIKNNKLSIERVDVLDPDGLKHFLEKVDVVVNTTGPFYILGERVAKAAIKAKVGYVDICDDPEPTLSLLELHESAKSAGVTLIIGLGCTPGATNLMAKSAANEMDKVDDIKIAWLGKTDGTAGEAVMAHVFHMLEAPIPQYIDRKVVDVEPYTGDEDFDFDSHENFNTVYIKHPEPVTLYKYIEGVKNVTVKANAWPDDFRLDYTFKQLAEVGLLATHPIPVKGTEISPREFVVAMMEAAAAVTPLEEKPDPDKDYALELLVKVFGEKDGRKVMYRGYLEDTLERATGLPAAIGALMIVRGQIQEKGAFPPEGCIDPKLFFEEMKKRNIRRMNETFS